MYKIDKILIGTHNKGKFKEISDLLPKKVAKVSPNDLGLESPKENGKTFLENSELKANFFCDKSKLVTLSDDSGLEIDILGKQPGIYSARWAGKKSNFDKAIERVYKQLNKKKVKWNKKIKCRFICALTIYWPNHKFYQSQGIVEGTISNKPKGNNGFGYDPIFLIPEYGLHLAEMKKEDKNKSIQKRVNFSEINLRLININT